LDWVFGFWFGLKKCLATTHLANAATSASVLQAVLGMLWHAIMVDVVEVKANWRNLQGFAKKLPQRSQFFSLSLSFFLQEW
jgi:hypothetical protein